MSLRAGHIRAEVTLMFLIAVSALIAVIATLLWYTNWAEARVLNVETEVPTADTR